MKTCSYCKKKMKDSQLFCPRCGQEYRYDLNIQKNSPLKDYEHYAAAKKEQTVQKTQTSQKRQNPKGKKSPQPFSVLVLIFLLFLFPMLAPFFIIIFIMRLAANKKRGQ